MSKTFQARPLDVAAFVQARDSLSGSDLLQKYERLTSDLQAPDPDSVVNWRVQGEQRSASDGSVRPALHLQIAADLPLTCQRCMGRVLTPVRIDRHLVFAPDEATASALDDESDDDVLELTSALDLQCLIEDELLMALPLVPRHDQCPSDLRLSVQDADFEATGSNKPNPFAALAALKDRKPD